MLCLPDFLFHGSMKVLTSYWLLGYRLRYCYGSAISPAHYRLEIGFCILRQLPGFFCLIYSNLLRFCLVILSIHRSINLCVTWSFVIISFHVSLPYSMTDSMNWSNSAKCFLRKIYFLCLFSEAEGRICVSIFREKNLDLYCTFLKLWPFQVVVPDLLPIKPILLVITWPT